MEAVKVKTKHKKSKQKCTVNLGETAPLCEQEEVGVGCIVKTEDEVKPKSHFEYDDKNSSAEETERLLHCQSPDVESVKTVALLNKLDLNEKDSGSTELEEIVANVVPTVPELASTHFQNLISNPLNEIDERLEAELTAKDDIDTDIQFPYSDIEDEFADMSNILSQTQELPSFTEAQLLSLYINNEVGRCNNYIESFIDGELRGGIALRHPLYDLLANYVKFREKQFSNSKEVETLIQDSKNIQQQLWILNITKITESGECQDGNPVEASHEYQIGSFNTDVLAKLVTNLATIREKVHEQHALFTYSVQITKLEIDSYVQKIAQKFPNIQSNYPVSLMEENYGKSNELCQAISVLFHFQRQHHKDQGFIQEARQWLSNLISILLRVASWHDHVFIISHVLRCPGGMSKWAVPFIQIPQPPPKCINPLAYLNHMIAIISIIVSPIKDRELFLSQLEKLNSNIKSEDVWVIVDSEGEEEEENANNSQANLKENDIISIFNQIPLDSLFRQTFLIITNDNNDVFAQISSSHLLKIFAISRYLIKILEQGIITYHSIRYQQFAKRLASIILHIAQYTTDAWEIHKFEGGENRDESFMDRLQAEYDNIIICACSAFQATAQKSVLQFLISLPFGLVSMHTLWKLFHMVMHTDAGGKLCKNYAEWSASWEEKVVHFSDAELYYILTSVSNMALSRMFADWVFIKMVTVSLLQIGFVNISTRDTCYKTCRSLLSNMATKYPSLITVVLKKLRVLLPQTGNLSLYIFKDLPLYSWRPTEDDLSLLEHWLLACPLNSIEASLARFILYYMNWGLNPNNSHELFLPREFHCQVALFVVRLSIIHCPETPTSAHSTVIADTIKQLTFSSDRSITEQSLGIWVWSLLFKLRLHLMDQPDASIDSVMNPLQNVFTLPSLESLPNELSPLTRSVKEKEVTAIFVSLVMTMTGHNLTLIEQNGFKMMNVLIQCHRYLAVLVLLEHITPLFLGSQDNLHQSENFHEIIKGLLTADKTFVKYTLGLISSSFPGIILKQFGFMIQSQIENYRKKYKFQSPSPFIELWLRALTNVWILNPSATTYLMDIVLRAAFFQTQTREIASDILIELLQQIIEACQKEAHLHASKQKFSLLNWVSGNSNVTSLLNKPTPETPWFSLFAIEIEEKVLFSMTNLWTELLIDLSCWSGKTTIDASLKRCCASLKLSYVPCSTLPIYRWSQQVLETPVDHPVMPVLWQKFFFLFLSRMPTTSRKDLGSVGLKFFEGSTNQALLKKLKKKLNDCQSFFEAKCNNPTDIVSDEKKNWYNNMAKLYTSFSLWLDSPGLHEPSVFIASLPPMYNIKKLSTIFQGDKSFWYEYIDYEGVRANQRQSVLNWEQCTYRHLNLSCNPLHSPVEPDPLTRTVKRLQKYESPLPPPAVVNIQVAMPETYIESLFNKSQLLEMLKEPFKSLSSFAQVHKVRSGEHSSIDYCLIELVPLLYDTVETNVTLHAACDTHNPGMQVTNMHSLNCAGPAVIRIKVPEVRVNQPVDLAIHNNRVEAHNLIKRSMHPSPFNVVISSLQIQQAVRALEEKCIELRKIGDVHLLERIHDTGVSLFYQLTYLYTEEAIAHPPMKQLITTCIEILGRCFVSVDESQGPLLLSRVLETPSLTSLLSTHFSPTTSSPQIYIQLYRTLLNAISASNYDLTFVFLTKFDIGLWIETQKPRSSDRSVLIDLVGQALASAGQTPHQEFIMIHEVLRRQFCLLMMVEAPQHFTHSLSVALKYSESHSLAIEVWYDIVNAIVWQTGVQFRPHSTLAQVVGNMAKFAVDQTVITLHEAIEISNLISDYFQSERLQYGLYGLYPKYRVYISPLTTVLGTISHALIILTIKKNGIGNNFKVGTDIWQHFINMYSPWICPYYTKNMTQPTATWIQQLTDDRSILLPWISTDSGHAHKVLAIFTESIRFFLDSVQGTNDMFSQLWQYYVNFYANPSVPEHVLSVVNDNLLSLPWNKFFPSLLDLELMLKVSDTYVPFCHTLLGAIFIEIPWLSWLDTMTSWNEQNSTKILSSFLHLIIKLSNEPNVRQSGKILDLLRTSKSFHWEHVDFPSYESVVNWFVMSYDPRVILNLEEEGNQIDHAVMELLRYAAGFVHGESCYHSSTPSKRQVYVRGCMKMIVSCLSKYKSLVMSNQGKVQGAIEDILIIINTVVPQSGGNHAEAGLHIGEVLTLVNLSSGPLPKLSSDTIVSWVSKRGDCIVSSALLRTLGTTLEPAAPLGEILESVLEAAFNDRSGGGWNAMISYFQEPVPRRPSPEEAFSSSGHLLSLYLLLNKQLATIFDLEGEAVIFSGLVMSLASLKENPDLETKIVPLFHLCLVMASRLADEKPQLVEKHLKTLVRTADNWAEYKPSWGFLGAIGIKKQPLLSNKCKLLCSIFSTLVLCQLPERKGELPTDQLPYIRTTPHSPGGLTSNNMELGLSNEAIKTMATLTNMQKDKIYFDMQHIIDISITFIRKTDNSLHNAHQLYLRVAKLLYNEVRFIQSITLGT
ncbi:ectopic P granules protein 5 homolog [Cimex lectularius]|uniref:Ectopic P granules protein 5 homolog n=1 Tax=Cimex lectularius TaxID=79782 RepID=A0A8I6RIQ8_CIMLE|nr:ectopic P granules protein 5 homolog [Cimex lectularius]